MKIYCLIAMLLFIVGCGLLEDDYEYEAGDLTTVLIEGCAKERERAISEALSEHSEGKIPDICEKIDKAIQEYNKSIQNVEKNK